MSEFEHDSEDILLVSRSYKMNVSERLTRRITPRDAPAKERMMATIIETLYI